MAAAALDEEGRFDGSVTSNGVRVHDFEAIAAGARAVLHVTVPPDISVIVARIAKPPRF